MFLFPLLPLSTRDGGGEGGGEGHGGHTTKQMHFYQRYISSEK